ncbi:hypothetical protein KMY69_27965, partial [Klebsiella pneumoniae]|uniref:hypothetical protein n=1 Tax=Klebsiella pneumoniae TaxID=573 RepID=UPI002002D7AD
SDIDADTTVDGNQQFVFIGTAGFSRHAGELRFSGGFVFADTNGNGTADMAIKLENTASMQATDFQL